MPRAQETAAGPPGRRAMPMVEALRVLAGLRRDEIVVTTMGAAREWPRLSSHPLDLHYIPSAMGHAPALGLGLALARPERQVWVLNGDGCQLMSLGSLVTIAGSRAHNLTLFVLENGLYEVTGGQATAAGNAVATGFSFATLARGAGLATVAEFDDLEAWKLAAQATLYGPGPRCVVLRVAPVADFQLASPGPLAPRLEVFQRALSAGPTTDAPE